MHFVTGPAIIVSTRRHGEHGAVVRALTETGGLQAGYVRGGHSTRLRPVLMAGNLVTAEFRSRNEGQLAALTVELTRSRAPLFAEPMAALAIEWLGALTTSTLPEGHPYPRLYTGLDGALTAIEMATGAREWAPALAAYERLIVEGMGFGVSARGDMAEILRDTVLTGRRGDILAARERLMTRLDAALGD